MRKILIIGLAAAGIGLAGASGAAAAPANGVVIRDLATTTDPVTTVQHWRWGSYGGHYRWGSYGGHYRWRSYGGHYRWGSRGWRR
jgi:ABC-type glycerol-3-phosphate transport system substrate-binding protein